MGANTEAMEVAIPAQLDRTGLAELYGREAESAKALAYLLTGDWPSAEDLVHEAFVRLAGRWVHLRKTEAFHQYLRRTLVNLHISRLRRLRLERAWLRSESAKRAAHSSVPDMDTENDLLSALRVLPKRQQAAVVLRYCFDLSEAQVAEEMSCSLAAARGLIARGIRTLRRNLGGGSDG
jgi:RNA polymerase sigma-70 factor (sigma-E family)